MKIVIEVSGGIVTDVYSDLLIEPVFILDRDNLEVGEPFLQMQAVDRLSQAEADIQEAVNALTN